MDSEKYSHDFQHVKRSAIADRLTVMLPTNVAPYTETSSVEIIIATIADQTQTFTLTHPRSKTIAPFSLDKYDD